MSRAARLCGALWIAIVGSAVQTGCIHNHYYGTAATLPGCPPVGSAVTTQTQVGSICDVPSSRVVGNSTAGAMVTANDADSTTRTASIAGLGGPTRVVISQPAQGPPSIGQSSGRIRWRKPDPEALPTMKAEGGLDDSVNR